MYPSIFFNCVVSFFLFFFLILSCLSYLFILEINPLSVTSLATIEVVWLSIQTELKSGV